MKVANRKVIRKLSFETLKSGRLKNFVAIFAIALTTVLFTALFTILLSIKDGYEAQNFRQVGSYSHGAFKYLTKEQVDELSPDKDIKEYGLRRIVGIPKKEPFLKNQVEISFCEANTAKWMFIEPVEGSLPREGTNEAATDTTVLALLGVEPVIGTEFTVTFDVDGTEVTETFVLSGYWEYDPVIVANHVLIPLSRAEEIFAKYDIQFTDGIIGSWNMDVMFNNSSRIPEKLSNILERHGYQTEDRYGDNYIAVGVNWGYVSTELFANLDFMFVLAMAAVLLLIIFTGYLVIYNVFRISVANDIRFYGLLKTIGTTGRQLKRIIRQQALCLSVVGIPAGLILGWLVGSGLTKIVTSQLKGVGNEVSGNLRIFIGSALFSLFTVYISCRRPGKLAAAVSPIEAVRYTESEGSLKKLRSGKAGKGASLPKIAWANLGRSRSKTAVTVISLSLSLVLLTVTVTFTGGFDMDKYLRNMQVDFMVGDAGYFQSDPDAGLGVSEELILQLKEQGGIAADGRVYRKSSPCYQYVTEEVYRNRRHFWPEEALDYWISTENREQGLVEDNVQLCGLEPFILDHMMVVEGDLSKLYGEGNYIAAVYYGAEDENSLMRGFSWAKVGDKVLVRYADELEYYDPDTGEVYPNYESIRDDQLYSTRPLGGQLVEYEVAAIVEWSPKLSYRYAVGGEYILNAETFKEHSGTDSVMYYAFDMVEETEEGEGYTDRMESFLADYTENVDPRFDYESKATYAAQFEEHRSMYIISGSVLSFIVGLVGVLNFMNVIVTGILSRKRELAVMQSVGMTGKQLKTMLVMEGLYYGLLAVMASLILAVVTMPVAPEVMNGIVWFFTYHFTLWPILAVAPIFALLGVLIPLEAYRFMAKKSVVERLREAE